MPAAWLRGHCPTVLRHRGSCGSAGVMTSLAQINTDARAGTAASFSHPGRTTTEPGHFGDLGSEPRSGGHPIRQRPSHSWAGVAIPRRFSVTQGVVTIAAAGAALALRFAQRRTRGVLVRPADPPGPRAICRRAPARAVLCAPLWWSGQATGCRHRPRSIPLHARSQSG